MVDSVYYDAEGILNKSLLIWIKLQTLSLKESIVYLLKSYNKTKEETEFYINNIEESLNDWFLLIGNDGMRLVYKPKQTITSSKKLSLKDIYNITILNANL